jgi:hypothetical protein
MDDSDNEDGRGYSDDDSYDDGHGPGSDRIMNSGSDFASEDEDASCSDRSHDYDWGETPPIITYMHLITLVEGDVRGGQASKVLGVYTTKEKAIKAARYVMKRRSGYYPKTGKCAKPKTEDHSATVGDEGTLFEESNEYNEYKTISLAKIPLNRECDLIITGP